MQTSTELLAAHFQLLEYILHAELELERSRNQRERRLHTRAGLAFAAFLAAIFALPGSRAAVAQGYGVTLATLNTRMNAVKAETQYQSGDTTAWSATFSSDNVFINDSAAVDTVAANATGDGQSNLNIGHSALHDFDANLRAGSHNLIVEDQNNHTNYGGVRCGKYNILNGYACVTGVGNTAIASYPSVSGGKGNMDGGNYSFVSGSVHQTLVGSVHQSHEYGWFADGTVTRTYQSP